MANENMIKFLRGNVANLPQTATEGALYFTKDEGIYLGMADGSYHRYGDFIIVENVQSLPATGAHETCMYYCTAENILARYDAVKGWVQINKQPTADEMKTLLSLGSAAYTDASAYDVAGAADAVRTYVGDIPNDENGDPIATSVVAYINKKTDGIATSGNLEALGGRVSTAEGEIDALQADSHTHANKDELDKVADGDVAKWATAYEHSQVAHAPAGAQANVIESVKVNGEALTITDKAVNIVVGDLATKDEVAKADLAEALVAEIDGKVKSVAAGDASVTVGGTAVEPTVAVKLSAAEGNALTLDNDGLKVIIPESTKVEVSATNGNIKVDGEEVTVYTHPDKHAIADVTGLEDALAGKQDVIPENTYDAYGSAAQALTDAKAYVDEEDIFVTDMNTINSLGGIGANVNLNGLTTHEVLKKLLYPYVAPSIGGATASPNGGTYEKGVTKTITQVSISITKKSEPITSVALYNGSTLIEEKTGDAVKNGGTITFTGLSVVVPTDGNQLTVKVTYPDANGVAKTESKSTTAMTFVYPYYMGSCSAGTAIDETLVESLTKKIESKGNKSCSYTVEQGYMVFAYPKAHGVLKSILDPNNFETIGNYTCHTVSVTGLDGTAQDYYVYVSGSCSVSGFTVNFKY